MTPSTRSSCSDSCSCATALARLLSQATTHDLPSLALSPSHPPTTSHSVQGWRRQFLPSLLQYNNRRTRMNLSLPLRLCPSTPTPLDCKLARGPRPPCTPTTYNSPPLPLLPTPALTRRQKQMLRRKGPLRHCSVLDEQQREAVWLGGRVLGLGGYGIQILPARTWCGCRGASVRAH